MAARLCEGRVCVVTGAGRGLGRAHALELARHGARVVVNDLGVAADGAGKNEGPAREVVDMIRAAGGEAVTSFEDVADWEGAGRIVKAALDAWGRLDVLVNNAGFVRDRMFVSTSEEEWDAVIRVHLKGHFAPTRHAVSYFRDRSKAGEPVDARIINTTSGAGLLGSIGQSAYSAAKAGIAALTLVQAAELGRYGVTSNAVAPAARTRMTETAFADMMRKPESGFDAMAPENVSPLVAWLASTASRGVTGRIFEASGGTVDVAEGWGRAGSVEKSGRWEAAELGTALTELIASKPAPRKPYGA
jgi:NAD(P)-dependent dehydrogenase (short-subunit alcohol dehydrogenase family)